MKLISLSGLEGSGKDTVAGVLYTLGYERISFSDSVKDVVSAIFGWDREVLEGLTAEHRDKREEIDLWWSDQLDFDISMRIGMMEIATRVMRGHFHQDIWVLSVQNKLRKHTLTKDLVSKDTRFLNELNAMKQSGAFMVGVYRKLPSWLEDFYQFCNEYTFRGCGRGIMELNYELHGDRDIAVEAGHEFFRNRTDSKYDAYRHESQWQHWLYNKYDLIIGNTGTLEDLKNKALALS